MVDIMFRYDTIILKRKLNIQTVRDLFRFGLDAIVVPILELLFCKLKIIKAAMQITANPTTKTV